MAPSLFTLMPFASFFNPGGWQFCCLFFFHLQFSIWGLLYSPLVKSACCCHSKPCSRKPQPRTSEPSGSFFFNILRWKHQHLSSWYMKYCISNFSPCHNLKGMTWATIKNAPVFPFPNSPDPNSIRHTGMRPIHRDSQPGALKASTKAPVDHVLPAHPRCSITPGSGEMLGSNRSSF